MAVAPGALRERTWERAEARILSFISVSSGFHLLAVLPKKMRLKSWPEGVFLEEVIELYLEHFEARLVALGLGVHRTGEVDDEGDAIA
jgi:hypothetical protein